MSQIQNIAVLDEFLDLVKEAATKPTKDQFKATQRRELDMWHTWNNGGRKPAHLKPLYESYKPLLQREANKFRSLELPTSTISAELRKQFVTAVKSYDPKRNTQLNTWVQTNLQKSSRFIKTYQNLGKIPESRISKINEFKKAREELANKLGYDPDTHSLADELGWPHKRVVQLHKELSRKDMPVSGYGESGDPAMVLTPKELEAIRILQYDTRLSPDERSVYEYTYGINGKKQMQPGQIAKATNIHPSKISRIRSKLKGFVQEAIEVL